MQNDNHPISRFFALSRSLELTLVKEGRQLPGVKALEQYNNAYWAAVESLAKLGSQIPASSERYQENFDAILSVMMRSSLTWRARCKPHGYAGDFLIMELFYDFENTAGRSPDKTPGENLIDYVVAQAHGVRLVQRRARYLRDLIILEAGKGNPVKILDVCGGSAFYFREALSRISQEVSIDYTIYDHDITAPGYLAKNFRPPNGVQYHYVSAPVKQLSDELQGKSFDLIISAGLYDYLDQSIAQTLTRTLYSSLDDGGTLAIANILDSEPRLAAFFRREFMQWELVTRSDNEMLTLLPDHSPSDYEVISTHDFGVVRFTRQ